MTSNVQLFSLMPNMGKSTKARLENLHPHRRQQLAEIRSVHAQV